MIMIEDVRLSEYNLINLILFGQSKSLTTNSKLKNTTTKLSMNSMIITTIGQSLSPFLSSCSSSAVDMMKVMVEMITMERENSARNLASLEVHGYSMVFHNQVLH